jgi:predicted  nucleic acid-binding Zn-ribbon protein
MDNTQLILDLRELQSLQRDAGRALAGANAESTSSRTAALRGVIPAPVLAHFDRLVRVGRAGVAAVRNGVCGSCHLRLPSSQFCSMRGTHDLSVCDNCGAFVYWEEPAAPVTPVVVRKTSRKRAVAA